MRTQFYSIEIWVPLVSEWQSVYSAAMTRDAAEKRLRLETTNRRGRLVNSQGKVVLHSGKIIN